MVSDIRPRALSAQEHAAIVARCLRAYSRARWPSCPPADLGRRLDAARVYLQFRWLGDRPDLTCTRKLRWRFRDLRAAADRLGLLRRPPSNGVPIRPAPPGAGKAGDS